jgi:hypothetical protein
MIKKIKAVTKFKGKSKDIAIDQMMEALQDGDTYMIGVYEMDGSGKLRLQLKSKGKLKH